MGSAIFVDRPPKQRGGPRKQKYHDFFDELRDNPDEWGVFPGEDLTHGSLRTTAAHIRVGRAYGVEPGEFEATIRGDTMYVRFVGSSR